ncbi:hypothetical protein BH23BAC3_BH23BAC3_22180 [soil metagenome]
MHFSQQSADKNPLTGLFENFHPAFIDLNRAVGYIIRKLKKQIHRSTHYLFAG